MSFDLFRLSFRFIKLSFKLFVVSFGGVAGVGFIAAAGLVGVSIAQLLGPHRRGPQPPCPFLGLAPLAQAKMFGMSCQFSSTYIVSGCG